MRNSYSTIALFCYYCNLYTVRHCVTVRQAAGPSRLLALASKEGRESESLGRHDAVTTV